MRALKVLTVAMGVAIVLGTTLLIVLLAHRVQAPAPGPAAAAAPVLLDEPAGTRIAGIAAAGPLLAVQLQGGGADRVVLLDPRTGAPVGRVSLAH